MGLVCQAAVCGGLFYLVSQTGSIVVLATAVATLAAALCCGMALYGTRYAARASGEHKRSVVQGELTFWCYTVGVLILGTAAGVALGDGIRNIGMAPAISVAHHAMLWAFSTIIVVQVLLAWFASRALSLAWSALSPVEARVAVPDPGLVTLRIVAVAMAVCATIGLTGAWALQLARSDPQSAFGGAGGISALAIGLVLAITACILALKVRQMLLRRPLIETRDRETAAKAVPLPDTAPESSADTSDASAMPAVVADNDGGKPAPAARASQPRQGKRKRRRR